MKRGHSTPIYPHTSKIKNSKEQKWYKIFHVEFYWCPSTVSCAKLVAVCFSNIAKFSNKVCFTGTGTNKTVTLPNVFGKAQMKLKVLPLGYTSENQPNPNKRCDFPGCLVSSDKEWRVFEGCAHSFHLECLGGDGHLPILAVLPSK